MNNMAMVNAIIDNLCGRSGFDAAFDVDDNILESIKQEMAKTIDAHLVGMGDPVGYACPKTMQGYTLGEYGDFACGDKSEVRSVALYTAPPIDLAAVREVIAELRKADSNLCDEPADEWADKLETAIKGVA